MNSKSNKNEFGEYVSLLNQFDNLMRQENLSENHTLQVLRNDRNSYNYKKIGEEQFNPYYDPIYYMIDDSST
jgi:hypothetical protein